MEVEANTGAGWNAAFNDSDKLEEDEKNPTMLEQRDALLKERE